ncbi:unnamed protein product [Enterobius vermicularis]|uniref:Transmembrane 9 superfamily member n=1 Tax=Enterobius vermicularis TaxID=51028 RepID=A0A0N4V270_ENTVE|nr:unnamed protein product [Enterobius vermicularis]
MNSVPYLPDISSRIKDLPFERRPIESLGAQKLAEKIRIANEEQFLEANAHVYLRVPFILKYATELIVFMYNTSYLKAIPPHPLCTLFRQVNVVGGCWTQSIKEGEWSGVVRVNDWDTPHSFTYKDGTSEEFVTDFVVKMVNLVFDTFILRGVARILHRGWIVKGSFGCLGCALGYGSSWIVFFVWIAGRNSWLALDFDLNGEPLEIQE